MVDLLCETKEEHSSLSIPMLIKAVRGEYARRGHAELTSAYASVDANDNNISDMLGDLVGDPALLLCVLCRRPPAPYDALVITERMSAAEAADFERRVLALRSRLRGGNAVLLEVCQSEGFARLDESAYAWLAHGSPSLDREPSGHRAAAR